MLYPYRREVLGLHCHRYMHTIVNLAPSKTYLVLANTVIQPKSRYAVACAYTMRIYSCIRSNKLYSVSECINKKYVYIGKLVDCEP